MGGCFSDVKGGQQAVGGGGIVGHLGAQGFGGAGSAAGAPPPGTMMLWNFSSRLKVSKPFTRNSRSVLVQLSPPNKKRKK